MAAHIKNYTHTRSFAVLPLLVLLLAQIGTSTENVTMSLSATALAETFGATTAQYQLANMVYALVAGALMIAGGMTGITIGWKKNFRIGAILCALGELVVALSPTIELMTWAGRIPVGLGASFLIPSIFGLVPQIYKESRARTIAYGSIGAAVGFSSVVSLGFATLLDIAGFRISFLVFAVYFFVVFLLSFKLPAIANDESSIHFDYIGCIMAASGLFFFLFGISRFSVWGILNPTELAPFTIFSFSPAIFFAALGLVILSLLLPIERKIENKYDCALIPSTYYKKPQVLSGVIISFLIFFTTASHTLILVPYLQKCVEWSTAQTSFLPVISGIMITIFSFCIPKFLPRIHPRIIISIGYILSATSVLMLILSITPEGIRPLVWPGMCIGGIGLGFLSSHASSVITIAINERDASQSGGIQATARNVGFGVSIATLGAVLLVSLNTSFYSQVESIDTLSAENQAICLNTQYDLLSDENFSATLNHEDLDETTSQELVAAYSNARTFSVRLALGVCLFVTLLGLINSRHITINVYNKEYSRTISDKSKITMIK